MISDEDEDDVFVDEDWEKLSDVKTVEPTEAYTAGWRPATLYKLRSDPTRVCLFFGGEEYEGLDDHYSFVDGVLRDGDGDEVKLVSVPQVTVTDGVINEGDDGLSDPELKELEEGGGGYLSNDDDDDDGDFLFDGDGDQKLVEV